MQGFKPVGEPETALVMEGSARGGLGQHAPHLEAVVSVPGGRPFCGSPQGHPPPHPLEVPHAVKGFRTKGAPPNERLSRSLLPASPGKRNLSDHSVHLPVKKASY